MADGRSRERNALHRVVPEALIRKGPPPLPPIILVVSSETQEQQNDRRSYAGLASHESYATALRRLRPGIELDTASCLGTGDIPDLSRLDGIVFAGSPIQMHE
ncbi:hypothetical protein, partial [Paracoccus nototheniae]